MDKLTTQLATISKEKAEKEREYNRELEIQTEKARQEKIQAALIKEIVKGRMADLIFEVTLLEVKENYVLNMLRNERLAQENMRSILVYKREELKL